MGELPRKLRGLLEAVIEDREGMPQRYDTAREAHRELGAWLKELKATAQGARRDRHELMGELYPEPRGAKRVRLEPDPRDS